VKPYYQDSAVTIYHGDCREVVPTLGRFDLLLTDPPYGIGEHGGACRTRGRPGYAKHENLGWDKETPAPWVFQMLLERVDVAIIWGGNYFDLPPSMGWLYWRKLMGGDFSDGELAWTSRKAALREFTKCPKGMDKGHPCEKPLELLTWCLGLVPEAQTVLDPFAGVGTTARAAKDLGRKAVLIEREEKYCEIAARRMGQEVLCFDNLNTFIERKKQV
jgi:site-specific DNA-methyltransferase (adenine-specific)